MLAHGGHEAVERQGVSDLRVAADGGVRRAERVHDALGGRVDRRFEEPLHLVVGDRRELQRLRTRARHAMGGGERDHDLAAAIRGVGAGHRQAERAAFGQTFALTGAQRRVGGEHHDAGSLAVLDRHEVGDLAADGHAVDHEAAAHAEVGERQHSECERQAVRGDHPGGRADPRLEIEARHAGAGPDAAFGHGASRRAVQRFAHVLLLDVHAAQVVEEAVVALAHDRHHGILDADPWVVIHHPAHRGVVHGAGALRVGEQHGRLDKAPLADGADPDDLAHAVGGEGAGDDTLVPDVVAVGQDGGDARAGGPAAVWQLGPAPRDGAVADAHAGHVGDGVQRAGGEHADGDAEVAQSAALRPAHPATPGCPRGAP